MREDYFPMTPLREQYLRIKKQFPDIIVFFRLGDFYESFEEDAKKVAEVRTIVLTARASSGGSACRNGRVVSRCLDSSCAPAQRLAQGRESEARWRLINRRFIATCGRKANAPLERSPNGALYSESKVPASPFAGYLFSNLRLRREPLHFGIVSRFAFLDAFCGVLDRAGYLFMLVY